MRERGTAKRRMARGACALALVAGVAGGGSSGVGLAAGGDQLWEARYNGPGNSDDRAHSLAVSPDGARVYVTGASYGSGSPPDYATLAYNSSTGAKLWEARYNPGNYTDVALRARQIITLTKMID
ncbi:MAG: hypothetical protein HY775_10030 [Acidobacteria bacterium]|nr:hypothetical protein [Acidobacteriota bacterium]